MTENSAKFNILKYAPKDVAVEIMKKLPPKDLLALCQVKDRRIRELCQNFLSRKDYQRIWGGVPHPKTYKKEDLEKLEKDVNIIEPNLEILITNLKGQPKDIQKMILLETDPETLLALCSIKDKAVQRVCSDKDFLEKYSNLHKKKLEELLMSFSKEGKDRELLDLLTIFGDYVDPSANRNQAILEAAEDGHLEVVKVLLEDSRVNQSDFNNKAIRKAAANGHLEVLKLLLKDRWADPSADDNYAIRKAVENGHTEVVKLLIKYWVILSDADREEIIHKAAENGHTEIVRLLKKYK